MTALQAFENCISKLFTVWSVFTSSGPVRTTAVFAPALSLSTVHSSVCLALKKLTPGSGDWSICLQKKTHKDQWDGASVCVCVCVCVCVFLSLLTSAPAIPVIWYQDPVVCKSIQYSLQSLQGQRKRQQKKKEKQKPEILFSWSYSTAIKMVLIPPPATGCQNTFFVPSQYPYFNPSLLKHINSLRDALLKSVLYRCDAQKLQNMKVKISFFRISYKLLDSSHSCMMTARKQRSYICHFKPHTMKKSHLDFWSLFSHTVVIISYSFLNGGLTNMLWQR